ncbi:MAG: hypothetical protein AAF722_18385 [Cyanobacteria bacterium P01_C01_bin.70]
MLCKSCTRKSNCLPALLAANDTRLYELLERLKGCDRYQKQKFAIAKPMVAKRYLEQMFTRHPA